MTADALLPLLKSTFGFDAFRERQAEVVGRVMAGARTLAVMPTGAGKSLTYQLPAVALDGCVVVVSPLIALMHDQLRGARAAGIDRKSVVEGKSVSVRVDVGGRRHSEKKQSTL